MQLLAQEGVLHLDGAKSLFGGAEASSIGRRTRLADDRRLLVDAAADVLLRLGHQHLQDGRLVQRARHLEHDPKSKVRPTAWPSRGVRKVTVSSVYFCVIVALCVYLATSIIERNQTKLTSCSESFSHPSSWPSGRRPRAVRGSARVLNPKSEVRSEHAMEVGAHRALRIRFLTRRGPIRLGVYRFDHPGPKIPGRANTPRGLWENPRYDR